MTVKSWNPGDVLTASDMDAWVVPLVAGPTTTDQSITSTTTLQNDNTLFVAVATNASYSVRAHLVFDGPASNAANYTFTGPSGSSADLTSYVTNATGQSSNGAFGGTSPSVPSVATGGAGANVGADIFGIFVTGGTAGNFTLQWCQNASSGTATRRRAKSYIELRKIG